MLNPDPDLPPSNWQLLTLVMEVQQLVHQALFLSHPNHVMLFLGLSLSLRRSNASLTYIECLSFTQSLCLSLTLSVSCTHTHTLSLSLSLSYAFSVPHRQLYLFDTLSFIPFLFFTISLSSLLSLGSILILSAELDPSVGAGSKN